MEELVVLVDARNNALGTTPKATVHTAETPLHRAFSSFIFNRKGELLITQRSHKKKTWPLVWSNSCCGHPGPDESFEDAAKRRLQFELGLHLQNLKIVLPDFSYQAVRDGIMEHEFCPVLVGFTDAEPTLNPDEVESHAWIAWKDWLVRVETDPLLSEWCVEETRLLANDEAFQNWLQHENISI